MDRERENGDVTDDSFGNWGGGGIVGILDVRWLISNVINTLE